MKNMTDSHVLTAPIRGYTIDICLCINPTSTYKPFSNNSDIPPYSTHKYMLIHSASHKNTLSNRSITSYQLSHPSSKPPSHLSSYTECFKWSPHLVALSARVDIAWWIYKILRGF